jgi:hypothetical protein
MSYYQNWAVKSASGPTLDIRLKRAGVLNYWRITIDRPQYGSVCRYWPEFRCNRVSYSMSRQTIIYQMCTRQADLCSRGKSYPSAHKRLCDFRPSKSVSSLNDQLIYNGHGVSRGLRVTQSIGYFVVLDASAISRRVLLGKCRDCGPPRVRGRSTLPRSLYGQSDDAIMLLRYYSV